MLSFDSLSNSDYLLLRYQLIRLAEGFESDAYLDTASPQKITIGLGFNLSDADPLGSLIQAYAVETSSNQSVIQSHIDAIDSILAAPGAKKYVPSPVTNSSDPNYHDPSLYYWTTDQEHIDITNSFSSLPSLTEPQAQSIFDTAAAPTYQQETDAQVSGSLDTREGAVLFSLHYNGILSGSSKLKAAIDAGDRAEAWFEIRYNSNYGASRTNSGEGIAKRRDVESHIFGLYEDVDFDKSTLTPTLFESLTVFRMFTKHEKLVKAEEAAWPNAIQEAQNDLTAIENALGSTSISNLGTVYGYNDSFEPAKRALIELEEIGSISPLLEQELLDAGIDSSLLLPSIENVWVAADAQSASYPSPHSSITEVNGNTVDRTGVVGTENDLILGSFDSVDGAGSITGGGDDVLKGGKGDDKFISGEGADEMDGGEGVDVVSYQTSTGAIHVNLYGHASTGAHAAGDKLTNIEHVIGSAFGDKIVGNDDANLLVGVEGNDTFVGGAGDDTFVGGEGESSDADVADYSKNYDSDSAGVDSSSFVTITLDTTGATPLLTVLEDGIAGTDTLISIEKIIGTKQNDVFILNGDIPETFELEIDALGGQGNDTEDTINGGDLDGLEIDLAADGSGTLTSKTTGGTITLKNFNTHIIASNSADTIVDKSAIGGPDSVKDIDGRDGDDEIEIDGSKGVLKGGAGDDTLKGGAYADTMDGGADIDEVSYEDHTNGIEFDLGVATTPPDGVDPQDWPSLGVRAVDTVAAVTDEIVNVERLTGSDHQDTLRLTSLDVVTVDGGIEYVDLGDNTSNERDILDAAALAEGITVDLSDPSNQTVTGRTSGHSFGLKNVEDVIGTDDDDDVQLSDADSSLEAGDGDDTLKGGAGSDTLDGGGGDDIADYSATGDGIAYDVAAGTVDDGLGGTDTLIDVETVIGSSGEDTIDLSGFSGVHVSLLGDGISKVVTDSGDEFYFKGFERIIGTSGADTIHGDSDIRFIDGGAGNDLLVGTSVIVVADEFPEIYGGAGEDTLGGGVGTKLYGGADSDTFVFNDYNLAADGDGTDYLSWGGAIDLFGGIRWGQISESPWSYNHRFSFFRYGENTEGEMIVELVPTGEQFFIANWDGGPGVSDPTLHVQVVQREIFAQKLMDEDRQGVMLHTVLRPILEEFFQTIFGKEWPGDDPLILDLDGDGIELSPVLFSSPYFDLDDDNFAEQTGWVRPDDGFLVQDINVNGVVDGVSELFGSTAQSGFTELTALDSNSDGVIDALDTAFSELRIWQDLNEDGVSDAGELSTLADHNIVSLSLTTAAPAVGEEVNSGNRVASVGSFTRSDATTGEMSEILFRVDQYESQYLGDTTESAAALALPELPGHGNLTDLRVAMTDDASLLSTVQSAAASTAKSMDDLRTDILPVLREWAGVPTDDFQAVPYEYEVDQYGTVTIEDFAYYDASAGFWKLHSGRDVVDGSQQVIAQPNLADVLAMPSTNGTWDSISAADFNFFEKFSGFDINLAEALTDAAARDGITSLLEMVKVSIDAMVVTFAVQGGLSAFFPNITYDEDRELFSSNAVDELTGTFEAILTDAPPGSVDAQAYFEDWSEILDVFLSKFVREAGYLATSNAYLVQNIVAAYESVGSPLSLIDTALAFDIPDIIIEGNGLMQGTVDQDIFYMDGGNDTAIGGAEHDVYIFGSNFGQDVIDNVETVTEAREADVIRFATYASTEITATRNGMDLILTVDATGDSVTVLRQFEGITPNLSGGGDLSEQTEITEIIFADGVVWDKWSIAEAVSHPLAGNELYEGTPDTDVMDGGAGNDTLKGNDASDLYLWDLGDGVDLIHDEQISAVLDDPDIVMFGPNINPDDLILIRTAGALDDLVIQIAGTSDRLTIQGQFAVTETGPLGRKHFNRIENFAFESETGTLWTAQELEDRLIAQSQTAGDDVIYGFHRVDTLDGGAGNDTLYGRDDSDVYIYDRGYGDDIIDEAVTNVLAGGGADRVEFGAGLAVADVTYARTIGDDLVITITDTGETLTVLDQFVFATFDWDVVESFHFDDGTIVEARDIELGLIAEATTSGDDYILGFENADTLEGGLGNDTLEGFGGNDTYVYNLGDGNDLIITRGDNGPVNTLVFGSGIAVADVSASRVGNSDDLILTIAQTGHTITVQDHHYASDSFAFYQIDEFHFDGGTIIAPEHWREQIVQGTANADLIHGFNDADSITGLDGDDTIIGYDGDNTIYGGAGNDSIETSGDDDLIFGEAGHDYIDAGWGEDTLDGGAGNDTLIGFDKDDSLVGGDGDDYLNGGTDDDTLLGGAGNDTLIGEGGVNIIDGGSGQDAVDYTFSLADWVFDLSTDSASTGGTSETLTSIEDVIGSRGDDTITGDSGANRLHGNDGHDSLIGGDGDDTLSGGSGLDTFDGGAGQDAIDYSGESGAWVLDLVAGTAVNGGTTETIANFEHVIGSTGDNTITGDGLANDLQGADGNDSLTGALGADTLSGDGGNDTLNGGANGDTYRFGSDDGQDLVIDLQADGNDTVADIVELKAGVLTSGVSLSRTTSDLIVTLTATGAALTVQNHFANADQAIEEIHFADATVWNGTYIRDDLLTGTSGDDSLIGYETGDTLDGGAGNDTLEGMDGADTYVFASGYGTDAIRDVQTGSAATDIVSFGAGFATTDVTLWKSGNDVIFDFLATGERLIVEDQFLDAAHEVEEFHFDGGTIWTAAYLDSQLSSGGQQVNGTTGDDTLSGTAFADTLDGGTGNDDLTGAGGSDIYAYDLGDGADTIDNASTGDVTDSDTILLGAGIGTSDVSLSLSATDLLIDITTSAGDDITVTNFIGQGELDKIEFDDGTIWTAADVRDTLGPGTSGNDVINGTNADEVFFGNGGDDTLQGSGGTDVYFFGSGDGDDKIYDSGTWTSEVDVLVFGSGIATTDLTITRTNSDHDDVTLTIGNDSIWLDEQVNSIGRGIDAFHFQDGTVWTEDDLFTAYFAQAKTTGNDEIFGSRVADAIEGGAGNDTIKALQGDDTLRGETGDDRLEGHDGADTYEFNLGDGADSLYDVGGSTSETDILDFGAGILVADILVTRTNGDHDDISLSISGTSDSVFLDEQFNSIARGVEEIHFDDATVWTEADIFTAYFAQHDTAGNDSVIGSRVTDTIETGAGNDTIKALQGDDTLRGETGDDRLEGHDGADTYEFNLGDGADSLYDAGGSTSETDILDFGAGILVADILVTRTNGDHDDISLSISGTGDSVFLDEQFNSTARGIEEIHFADATVWTEADIIAAYLTQANTSGNDEIIGSRVTDSIESGAGNDTIKALQGDDTLIGQAGDDYLEGYTGADTYQFNSGDGADTIYDSGGSTSETDVLSFGVGITTGDLVITHSSSDKDDMTITIGSSGDSIFLNEQLYNTARGIEEFHFDGGTIWTESDLIDAFLAGTAGNDSIYGFDTGDEMFGAAGNDTIDGVSGEDSLDGGLGDDLLTGGAGDDSFTFATGEGADTITDFTSGAGSDDVLILALGASFDTFAEVSAVASDVGSDTVLDFGSGQTVTLQGIASASLHQDDFLFV